MSQNYYKNLEQFIGEFTKHDSGYYDIVYGMEFEYKNKFYRVTVDQIESNETRRIFEKKLNRKLGKFEVALIDSNITSEFQIGEYHFIGWYDDIYDLLENCYIEGRKFKDVLLSDDSIIDSRD